MIRRVLKKGKGAVSYEEDVHYGDVLTIGRAADQAIFLPDLRAALNHARITLLASGQYKIESLILAGIRVDGEITYVTTAGAGAVVEIGNTRLTLLAPAPDFDGGVEVSTLDKTEQAAEKEKSAKPTRLADTGLSKRRPSWAFFWLVLIFCLALPMAGHYAPGFGEMLRRVPLVPSTQSWNPGTIDAAHHFFAEDCTRCHQHAWLTVRDSACLTCHKNTPAHADPAKFNLPQLGNAECRSCHQDHQGLRGLIRTDQRLCADCHADLKARTKNASTFEDVRDFGTAHPEFKIDLPAWDENGKFAPKRTTFAPDLKENSGLKFNHLKHLKPDLNAPKGHRTLACVDCHKPDAGGANMKPVNFEAMCHDCHSLAFDPLAPDREVPHGKVNEVMFTLNEYYARVALEGGYADQKSPAIVQERRRPGSPPLSQQQQQEALAWAREQARNVTESLFTGRACTTCHKVGAPKDPGDTWHIAPVRVSGVWYTEAKFTHAKHTTVDCEQCHEARKSERANDLLIPGVANCRSCHGGAYAKDKVPTTCISCHDYHQSATLKMGKM